MTETIRIGIMIIDTIQILQYFDILLFFYFRNLAQYWIWIELGCKLEPET